MINRGFHYSAAVGYPFVTEPYMASRYSDGSFPIWYGALDLQTTIYETAFHMFKAEFGVEGVDEIIIRERAVYKAHCKALLIDLSNKQQDYSQLIADEYDFTQQLGRRLVREWHPGLLAPSARNQENNGINTVIFNPDVLSNPRPFCYLSYFIDPIKRSVKIEREQGKSFFTISY